MFKNYLLSTYRNIKKSKIFTSINIVGLAIAMAASLLILHYVNFERSYDKFHENYENIYRLRYERTDEAGNAARFASCCPPAAARIRDNYPEVEKISRMVNYKASISHENKVFLEERIFFCEPQFLEILKFPLIEGDRANGIKDINTAFVSQSMARKYFGEESPIGKVITTNKHTDYTVTGIFRDIPANSHIKIDMLLSWANLEAMMGPDYTEAWGHTGAYTYLIARPGTDPRAFEQKLKPLIEAECPWLEQYKLTIDLVMQPLAGIHLNSNFMQEYEANGDADSVNFLFVIAVFIMVMAWVNYINLSTASALTRSREVGMRKIIGATRKQIVIQFFMETMLINIIAIVCAVVLIAVTLPHFNNLTGLPDSIAFWTQGWLWITVAVMFAAGILLSGVYPVIVLSSFDPLAVIKNRTFNAVRGISLRKVLVVFQFAVGLFLIISTMAVYKQLSFMRNQKLGFEMNGVLVVKAPRVRGENYSSQFDSYRETLLQRPDIQKISHVTEVPGRQIYWDAGGIWKAGDSEDQGKNYQIVGVDYNFVDLFDLELAAGRGFSEEFPSDNKSLMINEAACYQLGFANPDSAVKGEISYWGEIYPVIGVLKDYHQQSPRVDFEPHIFRFEPYGRGTMGAIAFKLNSDNVRSSIAAIENQYNQFFPDNSFNYFFLDDYYNQQYQSDELTGQVYSLFAILALVITIMGIYGLSSYSLSRMTREIGIRKVLGATVGSLFGMLTREFIILLAVANLIAWPAAYYILGRWLEGYAVRTSLGPEVYLLAGLATLLVVLLTVSYKVIKAARANPVDAIMHE